MSDLTSLGYKLQDAGYRLTPPRLAIVQVLEQEHRHLSPNEVLTLGQQIYPLLSRATVYRTLELLTELGLIRPIFLGDASQRYITAKGGHHHLVCTSCGATFEFESCGSEQLAATLCEQFDFEIQSHLLEFYGTCENCRQN
jgi:Fur family ferric uptake transcriptional regulator